MSSASDSHRRNGSCASESDSCQSESCVLGHTEKTIGAEQRKANQSKKERMTAFFTSLFKRHRKADGGELPRSDGESPSTAAHAAKSSAASSSSSLSSSLTENGVPLLLELFTSEGCSSCPPADEFVSQLERLRPSIVAGASVVLLSEHVDYWNYLGWADPFSSKEFSQRQRQYGDAFRLSSIYTPQLVIQGRWQGVPRRASQLKSAILEQVNLSDSLARIRFQGILCDKDRIKGAVTLSAPVSSSGFPATVQMYGAVALDSTSWRTTIPRGENSGRKLNHFSVVVSLRRLGPVVLKESDLTVPVSMAFALPAAVEKAKRSGSLSVMGGVKFVVFLQDEESMRIYAAAQMTLDTLSAAIGEK